MASRQPLDTERVLALLERIEEEAGRLYVWLSRVCADDEEASELFERLGKEEERHRDLVRFQRQLAKRAQSQPSSDDDAEYLPAVLRAIGSFRQENPSPALGDAAAFVMGLEDSPAEAKFRTAVADVSPNMARLINSLNREDDRHAESLFEFAKRRDLL